MGVYINMEMPTSCSVCELCGCYNESKGEVYRCDITMHPVKFFEVRLDNCPLVPVPEHGRLIDESMIPWCIDWYAGKKRYYTTPKNIEHLPTIIPADPKEEQA